MKTPLVSIIIPTYNRAHLIGETLNSIIAQTYTNWECIVVDDGSTDDTDELITEYVAKDGRFQYYHRPKNLTKGANACRNYGFECSSGAYIMFLDSDDLLKNTCLEFRFQYYASLIEYDFLVFQSVFFKYNIGDSERVPNLLLKKESDISRFIQYDYPWNTSSPLFRKEFISSNKLKWNESLTLHQDLNFFIQVLLRNPKYKKIISYPDVFIRTEGTKRITKIRNTKIVVKAKYEYLKSILSLLNDKNKLITKYRPQLYGLSLTLMLLFYRKRAYLDSFKIPFLFFKSYMIKSFILLYLDCCYILLRQKYYNKLYRNILDYLKLYKFKERIRFIHTHQHKTLGNTTLFQHLSNKTNK